MTIEKKPEHQYDIVINRGADFRLIFRNDKDGIDFSKYIYTGGIYNEVTGERIVLFGVSYVVGLQQAIFTLSPADTILVEKSLNCIYKIMEKDEFELTQPVMWGYAAIYDTGVII